MKKILKKVSIIVAIMLSISTFTMSVSAASTMSSLSVINAIYYNGTNIAESTPDPINKTSSANSSYIVNKLQITGTITTSQTGATNYLHVYTASGSVNELIAIPTSGTFTSTVNIANKSMRDTWYFQLVSVRNTTSGIAAATIKNGHVTFYY